MGAKESFRNVESLALELRGMLVGILQSAAGDDRWSEKEIGVDTELDDVGMNSVDFMEFVIAVEETYDVDITADEEEIEDSLRTLRALAEYLRKQRWDLRGGKEAEEQG